MPNTNPKHSNYSNYCFLLDSPLNPIKEFAQLCGRLLGPKYEYISGISSIMAVTGAVIVYWVLMSNFLMNTGDLIARELKYNVVQCVLAVAIYQYLCYSLKVLMMH